MAPNRLEATWLTAGLPRNRSAMGQVLVLNASYEPLNITSWRRATVMVLKGKAEGLEHAEGMLLRPGLQRPSVIRLRQFVRVPFRPLPLTRRNLFHRDGHRCQYCGSVGSPGGGGSGFSLSIDHVIPRSRGGNHSWENVTTACLRCNVHKGNRTPREAGMLLARPPQRPLSGPLFEAQRQMANGHHREWAKYVHGWEAA
jgi:5-methylcytosine-specific restriction endonuclease McrA